MPAAADAATSDVGLGPEIPLKKKPVNKKSKAKINTDWSEDMGSGAKVGSGQYPAKFSLSPNSTPNCTTDYVVYNTGLAGATSTTAAGTGTFANNTSVAGNTVVINGVTLTATGVGTDVLGGRARQRKHNDHRRRYIYVGRALHCVHADGDMGCVVSTSTPATNASNLVEGDHQYLRLRFVLHCIGCQSRRYCGNQQQQHHHGRRDQHDRGRALVGL